MQLALLEKPTADPMGQDHYAGAFIPPP